MGNLLASCALGASLDNQRPFLRAYGSNAHLMDKLKDVGLEQKHLHALHQIFSAMDRDHSGEINMIEFFNYIDLKRSRFSEKAFSVMDKDGSGEVDFVEFVLAVWNYCSFSHASLVRFAFDLYDLDGSGEIEHAEAVRCVREVWGDAWEESSIAQKIVAKLDAIMQGTASGKLSVQKFQEFAMRHPMLLFPAFQLQTEMQKKVLGEKFWLRAAKKRASLNPKDLNWANVQAISKVSKQQSSRFLAAIEDDLQEQIETKTKSKPVLLKRENPRPGPLAGGVRGFLLSTSRRSSAGDAGGHTPRSGSIGGGNHTEVVAIKVETAATQLSDPESRSPTAKRTPKAKKSNAKIFSDAQREKPPQQQQDRKESRQLVVEDLETATAERKGASSRIAARSESHRHLHN